MRCLDYFLLVVAKKKQSQDKIRRTYDVSVTQLFVIITSNTVCITRAAKGLHTLQLLCYVYEDRITRAVTCDVSKTDDVVKHNNLETMMLHVHLHLHTYSKHL